MEHGRLPTERPSSTRKRAAVPPIMVNGGIQSTEESGGGAGGSRGSHPQLSLPLISPRRCLVGEGQPASSGCADGESHQTLSLAHCSSNGYHAVQSTAFLKHPASIKQKPGIAGNLHSCMNEATSPRSEKLHFPALSTSSANTHQLHHRPNGLPLPAFSEISSIRLTPGASVPLSPHVSMTEPFRTALKNRIRAENRPRHQLLPTLNYNCSSNSDLDETNPAPLNPPVKSLSPYLGSGISDIPSFPSLVSPQGSTQHLSHKRALSTSPLSDVLDHNSVIWQSPNSLLNYYNTAGTPLSPNPNAFQHADNPAVSQGVIGHLVGQQCIAPSLPYKIQQRKTLIEQNHDSDSTTITTITNQVTYSAEHANLSKYATLPAPPAMQTDQSDQCSTDSDSTDCEDAKPDQCHQQNLDFASSQVKDEPFELYRCQWDGCALSFEDLGDLVQHIENTHIAKDRLEYFVCLWDGCPRRQKHFYTRYKLLIHMRTHSGEKPNKCSYPGCTKSCARLENLKVHLRTHTREKPYICPFAGCNKSFSYSSDRSKHHKTHYDQKPYACSYPTCSKRYTDPNSFRKHLKTHQLQRKKPRSELHSENSLDTCLSIQPLRHTVGPSSASSNTGSKNENKTNKLRAVKTEKHGQHAPQVMIQHRPTHPSEPPPAYSLLDQSLSLPSHNLGNAKPPQYFGGHFQTSFPHMGPVTGNSQMTVVMEGLHMSQGGDMHMQPGLAGPPYHVSVASEMSHMLPISYTTQPSPNPHSTGYMYNSNPGSRSMQVAYSPGQPIVHPPSSGNVYLHEELSHFPPLSTTAPGRLQHLPPHHSLTECNHSVSVSCEPFAVEGSTAVIGFPPPAPHHSLPRADSILNTHF